MVFIVNLKKVFLIGCGPGDFNYLIIKTLKILYLSKTIFYESLINLDLLNFNFKFSKKILVGKRFNQKSIFKKTVYTNLLVYILKYKVVSKLKSGDVNIFSRVYNEILFFNKNNINYNLIPGITSFLSTLSKISYVLTFRFNLSSLLFITYYNNIVDFKFSNWFFNKTIIYYMLNNNFIYILEEIFSLNFSYILIIESCSFLFEHIFIFNIYDLYFFILENNLFFLYPKIVILSYFINSFDLKKIFVKLY